MIWLVSPQNPLKPTHETAALTRRVCGALRFAQGPSMIVSDAETRIGSFYTIDTLRVLKARFPGVRFVWIMGADSLASFHRWRGWTQIMRETPVAVVARPGTALDEPLLAGGAPLRLRPHPAGRPPRPWPAASRPPGSTCTAPLNFTSSTALRRALRGRARRRSRSPLTRTPMSVLCMRNCESHPREHPLNRNTALECARGPARDPSRAKPRRTTRALTALERLILNRLDDEKAQDIVFIDLKDKSSVADGMIVASGRSHRHVGAMADHLLRALKEAGHGRARVEGLPHCDWVLIDAGDVIVHLFRPEVRAFYNIEKIWSVEPPRRRGQLIAASPSTPVRISLICVGKLGSRARGRAGARLRRAGERGRAARWGWRRSRSSRSRPQGRQGGGGRGDPRRGRTARG